MQSKAVFGSMRHESEGVASFHNVPAAQCLDSSARQQDRKMSVGHAK